MAPLEIQRDGRREQYLATVMERVYLPVAKSGGRPFVRRMLIAWDSIEQRGFALASDDSISTIVPPTAETTNPLAPRHLWQQLGFATELAQGRSDAWVGAEGTLELRSGPIGEPCAWPKTGAYVGFPFVESSPGSSDDCRQARFSVRASAMLEHRDDGGDPSLLDRLTRRRVSLYVGEQELPGLRIVTHCQEPSASNKPFVLLCVDQEVFWRDRSQFAARLGLDFGRMRVSELTRFYYQEPEGPGPLITCCYHIPAIVQYTVFAADGAVIRHVDSIPVGTDSIIGDFWLGPSLREGSHTRVLVRGPFFDRSASQHTLRVVDLALLPCPEGTKRNNAATSKSAWMLDGGCYPIAQFAKR